jgi:ribosome-binding factor A
MKYRDLRLGQLIRDELAPYILKTVEFENDAFVTLTEVEVTKKLDHAKVRISVIPSAEAVTALKKLKNERGRLQHFLNHKLNIKPMPLIEFEIDRWPENAANVEKALLSE